MVLISVKWMHNLNVFSPPFPFLEKATLNCSSKHLGLKLSAGNWAHPIIFEDIAEDEVTGFWVGFLGVFFL